MYYKNNPGFKKSEKQLIEHAEKQMKRLKESVTTLEKRYSSSSSSFVESMKNKLSRNAAKIRMRRIVSVLKLKSIYTLRT